jgi:hypothetical protein
MAGNALTQAFVTPVWACRILITRLMDRMIGRKGMTEIDKFGRPLCRGHFLSPYGRCNSPVFLGYRRCPWCDTIYNKDQIKAALKHDSGEQFRKDFPELWDEIQEETKE